MEPGSGRMDFEFERMSRRARGRDRGPGQRRARAPPAMSGSPTCPRDEAFAIPDLIRTKINLLPPGIAEVRTIEIVGLDLQADGGTHVANTREVGRIRVTGYESQGPHQQADPDRAGRAMPRDRRAGRHAGDRSDRRARGRPPGRPHGARRTAPRRAPRSRASRSGRSSARSSFGAARTTTCSCSCPRAGDSTGRSCAATSACAACRCRTPRRRCRDRLRALHDHAVRRRRVHGRSSPTPRSSTQPVVSIGGGACGVNLHLAPADLVSALGATVGDVSVGEAASDAG